MNEKIKNFISDEVIRQGHTRKNDHKLRCGWMELAWEFAMMEAKSSQLPTIEHMLHIAGLIEPINMSGYRQVMVAVGSTVCPDPERVPTMIYNLWTMLPLVWRVPERGMPGGKFTLDDFYIEFENIHPFRDGNGRTGKVIYNWILGTLDDPVLVADYFGNGTP